MRPNVEVIGPEAASSPEAPLERRVLRLVIRSKESNDEPANVGGMGGAD